MGRVGLAEGLEPDGGKEALYRGLDRDNAQIRHNTVSSAAQPFGSTGGANVASWLMRRGSDAAELVAELEFVWNQIKNNSPSSSNESAKQLGMSMDTSSKRFSQPMAGTDGPMKVLSPMSEEDEAELDYQRRMAAGDPDDDGEYVKRGDKWSKKMERAIVRLSTEIAALREQITSGREWRSRKERSFGAWVRWLLWAVTKHAVADTILISLILIWMRRRKDRRLEDHFRAAVKIGREYARKVLPSR